MALRRQRRRMPSLPRAVFCAGLLLLARPASVLATFTNNFDAYPAGARDCLSSAADASGCNGDDLSAMNLCLCSNEGNFVLASAKCIGNTDYADLDSVYTTMASACSYSNTPLTVSQKEFMLAGNGTLTSTTTSTSTTSMTTSSSTSSTMTTTTTSTSSIVSPSPTNGGGSNGNSSDSNSNDSNNGDSGMSSNAKIGIIAGAAVAAVAIVSVLVFFIVRMRRQRQGGEENRPMLDGDGSGGGDPGGGGAPDTSGSRLSYFSGGRSSRASNANTLDYKVVGTGVGPGSDVDTKWPQYANDPYLASMSPSMYGRQPRPTSVYELPVLDVPQMPAEMPATPLVQPASAAYAPQQSGQAWSSTAYR